MSVCLTLTLLPLPPLTTETAKIRALVIKWQGFCIYGLNHFGGVKMKFQGF
jgi:hypothetical protein